MLKFVLMTEQDRKEAAKLERRRKLEEERRQRIFNPRSRLIGIDLDTLNKQITEKNVQKMEEKRLEDTFAEQQKYNAQLALTLEQKEIEERKRIDKEINEFRLAHQRTEERREFDLYDPNGLKKSKPPRGGDNDSNCGLASAQKFEGEDLSNDARVKLQKEQTKAWLQQQINENNAAKKDRELADEAYQMAIISRDKRAIELANMERECRKKLDEAINNFNQALALENKSKKQIRDREEQEDNYTEIYNAVTGDFLVENPDVAQSNFGPGRCIGFMYKGMTPAEREAVRKMQLKQIEENQIKRTNEKLTEDKWMQYMNDCAVKASMLQEELEKRQRELKMHIAEENLQLAEEQKARKEYFEKSINSNQPTAAYFEQFNTTSR